MTASKQMEDLVEEIRKKCDSHIDCDNTSITVYGLEGEYAKFTSVRIMCNGETSFSLTLYSDQSDTPIRQTIFHNDTLATHQFIRLVAAVDVAYMPVFKAMLKLKAFKFGFSK